MSPGRFQLNFHAGRFSLGALSRKQDKAALSRLMTARDAPRHNNNGAQSNNPLENPALSARLDPATAKRKSVHVPYRRMRTLDTAKDGTNLPALAKQEARAEGTEEFESVELDY